MNSVLGRPSTAFTDAKGRTFSFLTYTLYTKYKLIFDIVRHLNNDFKVMKDYILQTIADMFDDIKTLIDISEFQKKLKTAFDNKGLLNSFRNDVIPVPMKHIPANRADVKKNKDDKKDDPETDLEYRAIAAAIAKKLAEDPNIKTHEVGTHKNIVAYCQ